MMYHVFFLCVYTYVCLAVFLFVCSFIFSTSSNHVSLPSGRGSDRGLGISHGLSCHLHRTNLQLDKIAGHEGCQTLHSTFGARILSRTGAERSLRHRGTEGREQVTVACCINVSLRWRILAACVLSYGIVSTSQNHCQNCWALWSK